MNTCSSAGGVRLFLFRSLAIAGLVSFPGPVQAEGDTTLVFSSNNLFTASPVTGTVAQQLATLNSGKPTAEFTSAVLIGADYCSGCADVPGVVEVSLNNTDSAFYRFEFIVPPGMVDPSLTIQFATDDQGVAFLNGVRITALMTASSNFGSDSVDGDGLPILTWPSIDTVTITDPGLLPCGPNELLIGLCGNCSSDPTGLEFKATLTFRIDSSLISADLTGDRVVNGADLGLLLGDWGECPARGECSSDLNCDGMVDGADLGLLISAWTE